MQGALASLHLYYASAEVGAPGDDGAPQVATAGMAPPYGRPPGMPRCRRRGARPHRCALRHCSPATCLQVIMVKEVEGVGKEGELLTVPIGYWRNYLAPRRIAKVASEGILE